jgi:hypothetical protein
MEGDTMDGYDDIIRSITEITATADAVAVDEQERAYIMCKYYAGRPEYSNVSFGRALEIWWSASFYYDLEEKFLTTAGL